ncbi:hypothetical protein FWI76_09455, partial [Francisella tularensis subsp. holarctica]|nr:hypothetical protein [Francisella tularensis subsp. holarctica]
MADHPLKSAMDRSLGGPLPHQLANPTQAHPSATARKPPLIHRYYAVLTVVSNWYPPQMGR